ncbi:TRL domain-containing protein [Pseudomonadota bacterium]
MKKLLILPAVLLLSSCAIVPSHTGNGILGNTKEPITVTSNMKKGSTMKVSKVCGNNYLGLVNVGDISVETAMKKKGIKQIVAVEKEVERYVLVAKICTVVKGY